MEVADIIGQQYKSIEVDQCLRSRFPADLVDDVKQDLFEILLKTDGNLIIRLFETGKLKFYVVRIILNLSRQERNVVFKNYRQKGMVVLPDLPTDDHWDDDHERRKVEEYYNEQAGAIQKLHWYERGIFEMWVRTGRLIRVSDITGIPYHSLKDTVRAARKKVKRYMEEVQ